MDSLPPDDISVLTGVVTSRLPSLVGSLVSWLSELLQDPRLQGVPSGYSFDPETSTLHSKKIPDTVPTESVLPASTVPDDQSSAGTAPRHESKSVHFVDSAVPSVQDGNLPLNDSASDTGILKNGVGDAHPGQGVATKLLPQDDGVPAAGNGLNTTERRADPDSGSVASEIPLAEATAFPVFDHLDRYSDVSSLSDASDDGSLDVENRALSENPHAYSSAEEDKAMRRGQTLTGEAPLQFNGLQEQPDDAESYVSNRSLHQPGHLSPIEEDDVDSLNSDLDHRSNRAVDQIDNPAEASSVSRRSLRRMRSKSSLGDLENYRKDRNRFIRVDPNGLPTHEGYIPAGPPDQRQTEIPLEPNDPVARDHSVNGTDVLSQLRETYSDFSNRISQLQSAISQLESIVATMTSIFDGLLSTGSSRPEDRTADAVDQGLKETSLSSADRQVLVPGEVQDNRSAVANGAVNGDVPLASGFYGRPGSPVLSLASAAPAKGTPPAVVRKGGQTEYRIRKDPEEGATAI